MKAFISCVVSLNLLLPPGMSWSGMAAGATAAAQGTSAAAQTTSAGSATSMPPDGGWPRAYEAASGARIVLYEPQIETWADQKHIVLYSAVAYSPDGTQKPALGTIRVESDTKVAVPERLVNFSEFKLTSVNFPTLSREQMMTLAAEINSSVPRNERVIGLDRVLAYVDASQVTAKNVDKVRADPPAVFYSDKPAILVNIDGEPIWSPIKDNDLRFAVNTNWDLFEYPPSKTYYLRNETSWMSAPSVDGPWAPQTALPGSFSRLPDDDNWKDVKAALTANNVVPSLAPAVFISKKPGELILLTGTPKYMAVAGTGLLWVSNTDSDIFRAGQNGLFYYLVSGRWFSAPALTGPWTFATPTLPADFKKIPLEHPRSRVLASVPGTTQALEAVLLAQVPQTARVNRKEVSAPEVIYRGEPQFEAIPSTTVARAANTDKDIIKVGDLYYLCFEGVWFMSREANGPWTVADSIPSAIYEIPISSPSYNVTNVTVESSDDEWVDYAASAAYTGMMVAWGTAVWGTGYYYPPYYWGGGYYPVYYPRYPSYGYGARYNPWNGAYTRAGAVYGPYGGAGYGARYNPGTGAYSRGAAAWGPAGARGAAQAWNPRTGTYAQTRQGASVYGNWGATGVQRGDQWARTSHVTNRATGNTTRVAQGSGGNMYAGRDGNVYRNQGSGWQKYSSGGWSGADRAAGTSGRVQGRDNLSSSTTQQLNRDRAARMDGAQRTRDLSGFQSGSSRNPGSYRPSGGSRSYGGGGRSFGGGGMRGGGMRGGGGRR